MAGLFGKPTVVNNVETFATVPAIVSNGAEWFSTIGAPKYPGTKIFCLSGDVIHRGCFEVPTNANLKEIVEQLGGIPKGIRIKAVQVGGSSCGYLTPDKLDTPVDFDSMRAIWCGTGLRFRVGH